MPDAPPPSAAPDLPVPEAPPDPQASEAVVKLGSIEIPRLDINETVFEGITLGTFDRGPGHWPGTAMPGALGNVVIGGHRTSKTRPFRHLEKLEPGDDVILTTDKGRFVYVVVRTEIVTPESLWIVDQTNAYTATLFACHPVGSTKERIIVFLELSV
ncbi:MAG: class E sortase [Ilumatobacteraceae bacterium]